MNLGERLKRYRNIAGFTLREVEDKAEISNSYLNQLENGKVQKPSPNILHSLSKLYGVSYGSLMESAGYTTPIDKKGKKEKLTSVAFKLIEDLSEEEEKQLLTFLEVLKRNRTE